MYIFCGFSEANYVPAYSVIVKFTNLCEKERREGERWRGGREEERKRGREREGEGERRTER
jgi:hypothetical protein